MDKKEFGVVEQRTWQVAIRGEDGQPQIVDLNYERKLPEVNSDEYHNLFIRQTPPYKITPSRRVRPSRDTELMLILGDTQHPYHDSKKIALANIAIAELMPNKVLFTGDDVDLPSFGTYEQKKEFRESTQAGLDSFAETLAGVRATGGKDMEIIVLEGNHNVRLEREIQKYNGELIGLKRARAEQELGVLTLGFLMRFEDFGADYITGYPNTAYWLHDHTKAFHGTSSVTRGSTMSYVIGRENVNVIQGHSNRAEIVYKTFMDRKDERTIWGLNPGTLCDFDRVPSATQKNDERGNVTKQRHDWQSAIGAVYYTEDGAKPYLFPIDEQGLHIMGKTYRS